jgi:hypothetical protein
LSTWTSFREIKDSLLGLFAVVVVIFWVYQGNCFDNVFPGFLIDPLGPKNEVKLIACLFLVVLDHSFEPVLKANPVFFSESILKHAIDGMTTQNFEFEFLFHLNWLDVLAGVNLCKDKPDYNSVVVFEGFEVLCGGKLEGFFFEFVWFEIDLRKLLDEFLDVFL